MLLLVTIADAATFTQVIKAASSDKAFHVEITREHGNGYVRYTVTNLAEDWPRYTLVGVYYVYGGTTIANQRIKLKKGESYTLQGTLRVGRPMALDMRIKPDWFGQQFSTRFVYDPAETLQAENVEPEVTTQ